VEKKNVSKFGKNLPKFGTPSKPWETTNFWPKNQLNLLTPQGVLKLKKGLKNLGIF